MPLQRFRFATGTALLAASVALCALLPGPILSQEAADQPSIPVLRTGTRLIVEDVLVTDAEGKPIHGLPKSAFHVFDQGKAQNIRNFEEDTQGKAPQTAPPPLPPGAFSNSSYLYSADLVSNVFLIDADQMEINAQMFLLQEIRKSINSLPPGVQASVFCQASGRTVQMRGMTSNRSDLFKGVNDCIPRQETNLQDTFASGMQQLVTVAASLQPLPGRKNILWFSGPFPFMPLTNVEIARGENSADYVAHIAAIHQMQNMLAEARIAVFPIDPRGVVVVGTSMNALRQEQNYAPSAASTREEIAAPSASGLTEQYTYMQQLAEATGGAASHLNNLQQQIDHAISLGQDAYTLSYSPAGYMTDNSWHSIRVQVDGPYRVSYRHGYLATWTAPAPNDTRRLLTTGDMQPHSSATTTQPSDKPVIFTVQVEQEPSAAQSVAPASSAHHLNRITVSVKIPVRQLGFTHEGSTWQSAATVVAYAYDDTGKLKGGDQQELKSSLDEQHWQAAQSSHVATHQAFDVPRSAKYVLFVVTDKTSHREGTLLLPVRALRAD